jgi:hypothetical protein
MAEIFCIIGDIPLTGLTTGKISIIPGNYTEYIITSVNESLTSVFSSVTDICGWI